MKITKLMTIVLGLFFILGLAGSGFSQDFPNKPIRMIIPFAAGGGTDILARVFQKSLERELGTRILIENIPAGSTKVGTMELMKAEPNGYTLCFMSDRGWVSLFYSKSYGDLKVWEKLTTIGNITEEPYGFVEVRVESPYKTWADLVKAAKENPGKLTCGGSGAGGVNYLTYVLLTRTAGIKAKYVPYGGGGETMIAVLGGHVDFRTCQPTEAITMIRAGKTRGLAVSTSNRMEALPDVPTFKEVGVNIGDNYIGTRGIWGPPNLPPRLVNIITKAIEKASKDPEFIMKAGKEFLFTVKYKSPDRMNEEIRSYDKEFGPLLAEAHK